MLSTCTLRIIHASANFSSSKGIQSSCEPRLCCCAEHRVGYGRKRFALVVLDGEFRVPAVAPVITQLITARNQAGADDLGIGVASMSGFSSTFKALQVPQLYLPLDPKAC